MCNFLEASGRRFADLGTEDIKEGWTQAARNPPNSMAALVDARWMILVRCSALERWQTGRSQRHDRRKRSPSTGLGSSDLVRQRKPGDETIEKFPVAGQGEFAGCLGVGDRTATIDDRRERRRITHYC
jgi:hypothetical protein